MQNLTVTSLPLEGVSREKQVRQVVPISKATLWSWVKDGRFPSPIKLSENITVWRNRDVLDWLEQHGA
nr:AlpA family phage regulatory protein [uncultured Moraxella sp.]